MSASAWNPWRGYVSRWSEWFAEDQCQPGGRRGEPTFETAEESCRFGHGARQHYGKRFQSWNPSLESQLKDDWEEGGADPERPSEQYRHQIRRGWESEEAQSGFPPDPAP